MAEPVKMQELITCPKCGESNPTDARHCSGCGASLAGIKPAPGKADKKKEKLDEKIKKKA